MPLDYFPDNEEGMTKLQHEIETNHSVSLAQLPRYLTHPEKREGKAASSVMIALCTPTNYNTLKCHKIVILFEHKKVTEYFTARSTDQYH
jgi:phage-related baseplate assembly protein